MLPARGRRLAHILAYAELNALICSGPRKDKQFTYALLEEIVPKRNKLTREEALAKLALKYFTSHGPAQNKTCMVVWIILKGRRGGNKLNPTKTISNQF